MLPEASPPAPALTKWAEIDAEAIRDNARTLKGLTRRGCLLMAMVKASGYGHGALTAARAALAGGADWLGISSIAEGLELRTAGFGAPILNVGWTPPSDFVSAAQAGIDI
ncbi:MAG: alanine racemase, partial [Candidatus Dormibacteraeota bacterium]|nr:alanine racemase [Candidatus Dormibacteraeota bacterium]